MLEIGRQNSLREIQRVEDDEAVVGSAPGDETISARIVDHLISLHNERCDDVVVIIGSFHPIYTLGTDCCFPSNLSPKRGRKDERKEASGSLEDFTFREGGAA